MENSSMATAGAPRERKKGIAWTEEEHRLFLLGLQKHGKGDWRAISRHFVKSRTPTQVASHAQKYFIRQTNNNKRKRRSSLFDIVNEPNGHDNNDSLENSAKENSESAMPAQQAISAAEQSRGQVQADYQIFPQDIASMNAMASFYAALQAQQKCLADQTGQSVNVMAPNAANQPVAASLDTSSVKPGVISGSTPPTNAQLFTLASPSSVLASLGMVAPNPSATAPSVSETSGDSNAEAYLSGVNAHNWNNLMAPSLLYKLASSFCSPMSSNNSFSSIASENIYSAAQPAQNQESLGKEALSGFDVSEYMKLLATYAQFGCQPGYWYPFMAIPSPNSNLCRPLASHASPMTPQEGHNAFKKTSIFESVKKPRGDEDIASGQLRHNIGSSFAARQ